ncbi:MAG TPA: Uma2 family endonuclease [Vicinamibacterales bacterium]|nr:Uma2 family endonuclease [Vicinamibacterales bacterium]
MSRAARLVTAEEFERSVRDERCELVDGRIVPMSPVSIGHWAVVGRLSARLGEYVYSRNLGYVGPELGVKLRFNPDTVFAPDVAFIRRDRVPDPHARGFWSGAPDLAIEVKSPDESGAQLRKKAQTYLSCGTALVLVVDPEAATASIHRPGAVPMTLQSGDDTIDLDPVVPGFRCTLGELFS